MGWAAMSTATRRGVLVAGMALPISALGQTAPPLPSDPSLHMLVSAQSGPVVLRVLVAAVFVGHVREQLAEFARTHPQLVLDLVVTEEDPSFPGTHGFSRSVLAGKPDMDVVLTGITGLTLGAAQDLWQDLPAGFRAAAHPVMTDRGRLMQSMVGEKALVLRTSVGGPMFLHRANALASPPRSAAELLDYARQNPGRFLYAQPLQSPFGRQFVTVLPYVLGDADPQDPTRGWDRSWAYLAELGRWVGYYPASGAAALAEMADGGCDLMPAPLATYLRRASANELPADTRLGVFDEGPLIPIPVFLLVPRNVAPACMAAIAALGHFLLRPAVQAKAFSRGVLPGDPSSGADTDGWMSAADQVRLGQLLPPALAARIAAKPVAPPLAPNALVVMLRRWHEEIGAMFGQPG
jgi:putative spermidine/putrescine transport system substrate-binding protein